MVPRNLLVLLLTHSSPKAHKEQLCTSQKFSSANHHSPPLHHLCTLPSSPFPHPHPHPHHQHHRCHHQRGRSCQGGRWQEVARKCRWAHQATTHGEEAETNLTSVQPQPVTKYSFSRKSIQDIPRMLLLCHFACLRWSAEVNRQMLLYEILETIITKKTSNRKGGHPPPLLLKMI